MSENLSPDQFGELAELIYDRKLIAAIKLLREWTSLDLTDAKDFVDNMARELEEQSPEKFRVPPSSGCGTAMLALLSCIGLAGWAIKDMV